MSAGIGGSQGFTGELTYRDLQYIESCWTQAQTVDWRGWVRKPEAEGLQSVVQVTDAGSLNWLQ